MTSVMNFGAGVQSLAVLFLVREGVIPRPDWWMFADVGDEPASVYRNLERAKAMLGSRLLVVSRGRLSSHVLARFEAGANGVSTPPFNVMTKDGRLGPVRRGCTADFKIKPLERARKDVGATDVWFGISHDEMQRMRDAPEGLTYRYPLVDLRWSRDRCIGYLATRRWPDGSAVEPARSACIYCPYRSTANWLALADNEPDAIEAAADFETATHAAWEKHGKVGGLREKPYLTTLGVPLRDAVAGWKAKRAGLPVQGDIFDMRNECAGVCGV